MAVIAMTREMGSGGRDIAQRLVERMGLTLILPQLVEHHIADHIRVAENAIHHRFEGGATLLERWKIGSKRLARYTEEEILALAQKGNVLIRGWGVCVLLRGVPHVARVRVCAPMEARVRRMIQRRDFIDRSAAQQAIERNDAAHKQVLRAAYGVDREDARLYDLVLNTERLSLDTCVNVVCDLVSQPEFRETEASRVILEDRALEARIRNRLREWFTVGMGVSDVEATASGGRVVLKGTAIHTTLAADAGRIAGAIAGVKEVRNDITVVHGPRGL